MFGLTAEREAFLLKKLEEHNIKCEKGLVPKMPTLEELQAQLDAGEITQEYFDEQDEKWELTEETIARNVKEFRSKMRLIN
jgi:hypothetical protein